MAVVSLHSACQTATAAPCSATPAPAPRDSLWHWNGWKTPTSPLVQLGSTHIPPSPQLCHQPGRGDSMWEQAPGVTTLMLLSSLTSQPESPRNFEKISNSTRLGVKSQLLAKVWLLSYLKGAEVRLAGPLDCCASTGRAGWGGCSQRTALLLC